jgi:hypothetical protein
VSTVHDEYAESIILGPGQTVEGRFRRLEHGRKKDGSRQLIAVLEIDGDERALWLHEKALRGRFAEVRPEPGELVRVSKAREKKLGGNGFNYWPIKVTAPEREPETVDWNDPLFASDDEDDDDSVPF